jgi:hypothetical protein
MRTRRKLGGEKCPAGIAIENAGKFEKRRQELEVDFAKAIIYTSE